LFAMICSVFPPLANKTILLSPYSAADEPDRVAVIVSEPPPCSEPGRLIATDLIIALLLETVKEVGKNIDADNTVEVSPLMNVAPSVIMTSEEGALLIEIVMAFSKLLPALNEFVARVAVTDLQH